VTGALARRRSALPAPIDGLCNTPIRIRCGHCDGRGSFVGRCTGQVRRRSPHHHEHPSVGPGGDSSIAEEYPNGYHPPLHIDSIIPGQDSDIVPALLDFYHCRGPVVDLTFGAGRFWSKKRPPGLVGMDIAAGTKGEKGSLFHGAKGDIRGDYRAMPFKDGSVGTAIWDPPHFWRASNKGRASVYGMYNIESFDGMFDAVAQEATRVLRPGGIMLAKLADELSRGRWNHCKFAAKAKFHGLEPFDLVIKLRHPSIRNPSQRQHRARRRHCFFVVCGKGRGP